MFLLLVNIIVSLLCSMRIDAFLLDGTREDILIDGNTDSINKRFFPHFSEVKVPFIRRRILVETPTYTTNCLHSMFTGEVVHPLCVLMALAPNVYNAIGKPDRSTNILSTLKKKGYSLSVVGDDTLAKLFPQHFNLIRTAYSFNIGDYDTVDNIVIDELMTLWGKQAEEEIYEGNQFSLYHLLGSDHIMHSEGLSSPKLQERYNVYDMIISKQLTFLQEAYSRGALDNYLLMVFSDHGMTSKGTHGGSSKVETHVPLIVVTPQERLRTALEKRIGVLVPQREILFHILSEVFDDETISNGHADRFAGTIFAIDLAILWIYGITILFLSLFILKSRIAISPIILMCQLICATCARFAENEAVPLLIALSMELVWETKIKGICEPRQCSTIRAIKYISYIVWASLLLFITRRISSILPVVFIFLSQKYSLRTELRYIISHLILAFIGHLDLFSYTIPKLYTSAGDTNAANPWSGAVYILLTDVLMIIIQGGIYELSGLIFLLFSSLIFRWSPLYNSICISRLIIGIVLSISSMIGLLIRRCSIIRSARFLNS